MSQLRHPNIVQIFDFNVAPDARPYFVMEYLEGRDLEARLRAGPLTAAGRHPHRRRGRVGACARARARRRASRPQAGEHLPRHCRRPDRRAGQGARLRHLQGQGGGRPDLAGGRPARHAVVHVARAGARSGARRSTAAPISSRWGRSPTGCSPARSRSRATTPPPCSTRSSTRIRRRCRCSCRRSGTPAPLQAVLDRALAKQPERRFGGMMELARAFEDAAERTIGAEADAHRAPAAAARRLNGAATSTSRRRCGRRRRSLLRPARQPPTPTPPTAPRVIDWELPSDVDELPVTHVRGAVLGLLVLALAATADRDRLVSKAAGDRRRRAPEDSRMDAPARLGSGAARRTGGACRARRGGGARGPADADAPAARPPSAARPRPPRRDPRRHAPTPAPDAGVASAGRRAATARPSGARRAAIASAAPAAASRRRRRASHRNRRNRVRARHPSRSRRPRIHRWMDARSRSRRRRRWSRAAAISRRANDDTLRRRIDRRDSGCHNL